MNKKNITIVIPIHEYNDKVSKLLKESLNNISDNIINLIVTDVVYNDNNFNTFINDFSEDKPKNKLKVLLNDSGDTDFCSQINFASKEVKTEYFTILEFDDELTDNFFQLIAEFSSSEDFNKSDIVLPLSILVNNKKENIAFANDAVWAQDFSKERGFLEIETTSMYDIFMVSGATFNTKKFIEVGGLKKDIKLFFSKEFFLRALHNGLKVSVLPKLAYKHMMGRDGSLFDNINKSGITKHEKDFYNRKSIEEYKFNPNIDKREITYVPEVDA